MNAIVSSKQTIRDTVEYHPEALKFVEELDGRVGRETQRAHLYCR
jgi:hypothetical protein